MTERKSCLKVLEQLPQDENERQFQYERSFALGTFKDPRRKAELVSLLKQAKVGNGLQDGIGDEDGSGGGESKMASRRHGYLCSISGALKAFSAVVEDWFFLALLGIIMAVCSLSMDFAIDHLEKAHIWLFDSVRDTSMLFSYFVWVIYVVGLISASAIFVHYVASQAIGSGIPEMKTILRGVILKEYLSFRTLISKMVGLTLSLGSGVPMGKEGPFVHVASVVANLLSHAKHSRKKVFENEAGNNEMLAAGCAVGVACTFSAPIGGVLFSIEVTSVFFAVRNYWRGFFAAIVSAILFRMLKYFTKATDDVFTVQAHFQTRFPITDAFLPVELPMFLFLGVICGVLGALFVFLHRSIVLFLRKSQVIKKLFMRYWIIYPVVVSFFISSISFPLGFGAYLGGEQRFAHTLRDLFIDCDLVAGHNDTRSCPDATLAHWGGPNGETSIFVTLTLFLLVFYFLSLFASTLPVPSGIFMPVFVLGAVVGRLMGEGLVLLYPEGMEPGSQFPIRPGAYAVVGAAAMCGAATHTVSIVVIVLELTGQLALLLPVMIAVLTATAICSCLQPSIYDSIIKIKHLPYLPDISHSASVFHSIRADQVMVTPVHFVAMDSTYGEIQETLFREPRLGAFPLVDSKKRLTLMGSVSRYQLTKMVDAHLGVKARQAEARKRVQAAIEELDERMHAAQVFETDETIQRTDSVKNRFTVSKVDREPAMKAVGEPRLSNEEKEAIFAMGMKRHLDTLDVLEPQQRSVEGYHTIGGMWRSLTKRSFGRHKKAPKDEFDLHGEDRTEWEKRVLEEKADFSGCDVDTSPFQIVEQTSLFKIHSLFSLLGLQKAYVSQQGSLVGVISLKELRAAVEMVFSGSSPASGESMLPSSSTATVESEDELDFIHPPLEVVKVSHASPTKQPPMAPIAVEEDIEKARLPHEEEKSSNYLDVKPINTSSSDPGPLNTHDKAVLIDDVESKNGSAKKKRKPSIHVRIMEPDDE